MHVVILQGLVIIKHHKHKVEGKQSEEHMLMDLADQA